MIITGKQIAEALRAKQIIIEPPPEKIGPNSADLRIGRLWKVINFGIIDPRDSTSYGITEIQTGRRGEWIIYPNTLYLGETIEYTETDNHVPQLAGRSSWARIGVSIHETAGFGDIGFHGRWTLEISSVYPTIIYRGDRICQIFYEEFSGETQKYAGKYLHKKRGQAVKSKIEDDYK